MSLSYSGSLPSKVAAGFLKLSSLQGLTLASFIAAFEEEGSLTVGAPAGSSRTLTDETGLAIQRQWNSRGEIVSEFQSRDGGLWTFAKPLGSVALPSSSLESATPSATLNGLPALRSPSGGFSLPFPLPAEAEQGSRFFALEFFLRMPSSGGARPYVEAEYPDPWIPNAETVTRAPADPDAIGVWQKVVVPVRFQTGLTSDNHLSVHVALRSADGGGLAFDFVYPRVLTQDVPELRVDTYSHLANRLDGASMLGPAPALSLSLLGGQTVACSDLWEEDLLRAACSPQAAGGAHDLITRRGRCRVAGVSGLYATKGGSSSNLLDLQYGGYNSLLYSHVGSPKLEDGHRLRTYYSWVTVGSAPLLRVESTKDLLDGNGQNAGSARYSVSLYDRFGRKVSEEAGSSVGRPSKRYEYGVYGDLESVYLLSGSDNRLGLYEATFDEAGEFLLSETTLGRTRSYTYSDGLLWKEAEGAFETSYQFDQAREKAVGVSFASGQTSFGANAISRSFSLQSNLISSLSDDVSNHGFERSLDRKTATYKANGYKTEAVLSDDWSSETSYCRSWGSAEATDVVLSEIDQGSRRLSSISCLDAAGATVGEASFSYPPTSDPFLEVEGPDSVADGFSGRTFVFTYDGSGALTMTSESHLSGFLDDPFSAGGKADGTESVYVFGPGAQWGRRLQTFFDDGRPSTTAYRFYGSSSFSSDDFWQPFSSSCSYEDPFRRLTSVAASGLELEIHYEPQSALPDSFAYSLSDSAIMGEEYDYDGLARLSDVGRTVGHSEMGVHYEYDQADRIASETRSDGAGSPISAIEYSYDGAELRKKEYKTYSGDTAVVSKRETYGGTSHRIGSVTIEDLANNTLDSYGFTYDRHGNRVTKYHYPEGTTSYQYARGKLLERVVWPDQSYLAFRYDWRGRRTGKGLVSFFYEGDRLVYEVKKQAYARIYLYDALGIAGFIMDQQAFQFLKNPLGDVVGIVAGGQLIGTYDYDAFGNASIRCLDPLRASILEENPIRWRGYYYDSETGLYWLGSRYYDPMIGRFITPDDPKYLNPYTLGGLDPYAYCLNNPIGYTDPTGHMPFFAALMILGAIGAAMNFAAQSLTDLAKGKGFDWGRSGIAAAAGFLGGMTLAIPAVGSYISAALTSGLNAVGQMAYSRNSYDFRDYFAGFTISAAMAFASSLAFGKLTAGIPFFADSDFFLSNYVRFVTDWGGIQLSASVIGNFTGQIAMRGFAAGLAGSAFDLPFSWFGDKLFDSWREWDSRRPASPVFGW